MDEDINDELDEGFVNDELDGMEPLSKDKRMKECFENYTFTSENDGEHCPRVFDGWLCWDSTPAGKTSFSFCPWWVPGFDINKKAHKICMPDGTWFRHPESNKIWSNYTNCVDYEELQWRKTIIVVYEIGYIISIIMLVTSLAIFCSFRSLKCTRVLIHKHLFLSFIISNIMWLILYRVVVNNPRLMSENPWWCQAIHILVQYFLTANYFWCFCEGVYLHTLLVFAFISSESRLLKGFYIFGWMGPFLPMSFYVFYRSNDVVDRKKCWISSSSWSMILSVPICILLLLSLIFVINILRVLINKINDTRRRSYGISSGRNPSISNVDTHSTRKAVRATLILIPLLGLHYLLLPFKPPDRTKAEAVYDVLAAASSSLQGCCVSVLFCFCNSEVQAVVKRKFLSHVYSWFPRTYHRRAQDNQSVGVPTSRVPPSWGRNRNIELVTIRSPGEADTQHVLGMGESKINLERNDTQGAPSSS